MANYNEPISGGERDRRILSLSDCYVKTTTWQSFILSPHLYPQLFFGDFMQHTINLLPFDVPNFVRGERSNPIALGELNDDTLEALCDQFRLDVFAKAHKQQEMSDKARK